MHYANSYWLLIVTLFFLFLHQQWWTSCKIEIKLWNTKLPDVYHCNGPWISIIYLIFYAFAFKSTMAVVLGPFNFASFIKQCLASPVLFPCVQDWPKLYVILNQVPPCAVVLCQVSIEKAANSYNCSNSQHICVKAQPSKVDANFLSIVFPVEEKGVVLVFCLFCLFVFLKCK